MVSAEADIQDQSPESAATSDPSGGGQGTSTDRGGDMRSLADGTDIMCLR